MIFQRPSGAMGLGHVGWGYYDPAAGQWTYGAVEGGTSSGGSSGAIYIAPGSPNGAWNATGSWSDMITAMNGLGYSTGVDIAAASPDVAAAANLVAAQAGQGYSLIGNNCATTTDNILTAYGITGLPSPNSLTSLAPNEWVANVESADPTASTYNIPTTAADPASFDPNGGPATDPGAPPAPTPPAPAPPAPAPTDPGATDPGATDPGAVDPGAIDPTDPIATDPGAIDPTDPTATDPSAIDPTDPTATDPGAIDPTDPGAIDPTDPTATDPGATDPGATDPGATDPGAVDPTDPGATDPGATDPGATDPGLGDGGGDLGGGDLGGGDAGGGGDVEDDAAMSMALVTGAAPATSATIASQLA
jgi:hypothetical protein